MTTMVAPFPTLAGAADIALAISCLSVGTFLPPAAWAFIVNEKEAASIITLHTTVPGFGIVVCTQKLVVFYTLPGSTTVILYVIEKSGTLPSFFLRLQDRQKIEENPAAPRHVVTLPGRGYRFERAAAGSSLPFCYSLEKRFRPPSQPPNLLASGK